MKFTLSSVKVVGNPGAYGWIQVHDFFPQEQEKQDLRGHLFALVLIKGSSSDLGSVEEGRELITRLHEEYFGDEKLSVFDALRASIEKVTLEYNQSNPEKQVQIVAASYTNDTVYAAVSEGMQASIFRNNILANILIGGSSVTSASGYPQKGDIFIIGTKSFFDLFPEGVIRATLSSSSLEAASEAFAPKIHASEDSSDIGAVIISFSLANGGEEVTQDVTQNIEKEEARKNLFFGPVQSFKKLLGRIPARKIYVRESEETAEGARSKKTAMSVGAILLILLVISIVFGIKQNRQRVFRLSYQEKLTQAQHSYDEAQKLFLLEPIRARELFIESKKLVGEMVSQGIKDESLVLLQKNITEGRETMLGEYEASPQLFIDLSLVSSGFAPSEIIASTEKLLALDGTQGKLITIALDTKKTNTVAGQDQVKGATKSAIFSDNYYVLLSDGIYKVGDKKERVIDKDWSDNALIYSYAGNIYVVDKQESSVYRYSATQDGFGAKYSWLAPGIDIDLSNSNTIAIDGSVWLGSTTGKITKILQGSPANFEVKGVDPTIGRVDSIYSNEELEDVYVLDTNTSRLVVLNKDGTFKAQYVSQQLSAAKGMVVSGTKKIAVFLEGDKLYSIELKHLTK